MSSATPVDSAQELAQLRQEKESWQKEKQELLVTNRLQALEIEKLKRQLWSPQSERYAPAEDNQRRLFADPQPAAPAPAAKAKAPGRPAASRAPRGPKPLDPALRRETMRVAAWPAAACFSELRVEFQTAGF